jgi:RNA polymerase sigma-70 factor (ECF subfamily)
MAVLLAADVGESALAEEPDGVLMARLARGEREALGPLMARYQRRLYRLALGYLRNADDALDVVQETFVRAYVHAGRWKDTHTVSAWLTRIAVNQAIDAYRREKRRRRVMEPLDERQAAPADVGSPAAERLVVRREMAERLAQAIAALPEKQRAVVLLRHREQLSLEEIGQILGLSLGTVKSSLHRALARLRRYLSEVNP